MKDDDESRGRFPAWVRNGQLVIALLTAAFTLYLSVQQSKIKKKQDEIKTKQDELALIISTKEETEKWADRTWTYVEKLSMPAAKQMEKEAIVIDLLDAIALANASQQGITDKQKILEAPLWIALATGNVEALGLIGNADNRRDIWFKLASLSGDPTVRTTAMEAMARSSALNPLEHLLRIYELSEHFNNSDILDNAIEQMSRVVRVMEQYPDPAQFREDDRIKPVISRLEQLRTSLPASAQGTNDETAVALQREAKEVDRLLAFLQPSDSREQPTALAAPPTSSSENSIKSLVEQLTSNDATTRRQSRQELAKINDPRATNRLLDELLTDNTSYRVRLGVASALYQAKLPIVIMDQKHAQALVELIGDDDLLIRKYASESLMKLTDPGTVKLVHEELLRTIQSRASASPNAVYNAVVVLGTWLRTLPSNLQAERTAISSELAHLESQLQKDPNWNHTTTLIKEMLRPNTTTAQVAASAGDQP